MKIAKQFRRDVHHARCIWGNLNSLLLQSLLKLLYKHGLSVVAGDVLLIDLRWYVTHAGLLSLAKRRHCSGIHVQPVTAFCDAATSRYAFSATVYVSPECKGFVGYGDADPSNISPLVHGAEMRIAETRAVNRALRKAYGIGICSVEEIGSVATQSGPAVESKKLPARVANGNQNGNGDGNSINHATVRDRLCQIIRQHQLDAALVKSYATDFCGVKTLRDATREQVENFVTHLAEWAEKDRNALLCQLNSYLRSKDSVA
ncbi:MAG TPA: hypothetical protein VFA90_18590 [Terriglobales bacterium]|nr:hypothetical protein [Terriglobales bacterium]